MAHEAELKVYEQLCISYRAIDDFRAKLLGFLPLVSGSGAFLLLNDAFSDAKRQAFLPFLRPIGLFGAMVTIGLFCYELYGIRKCHALIDAGARLETKLEIEQGQFRRRPRGVAYLINEPFAASVIYPAALAAWMFVARVFPVGAGNPDVTAALGVAGRVFVTGFTGTVVYAIVLAYGAGIRAYFAKPAAAESDA